MQGADHEDERAHEAAIRRPAWHPCEHPSVRGEAYLRSYLMRGLTRLPPRARQPLARLAGDRDVMITGTPPMSGALLRGLPAGHVQAWELVRGVVEIPVQEAFRRHVGSGSVVWDVGANVGYFSLLAARLGAQVHAFEPVPESAARLRANVAANGLEDRIELHEVAVGARTGRYPFLVVGDPSWSHLADRGRHAMTREVRDVEVVRLDDLPLPAPDLVKIDVEGSEGAVLEGGARILREHRPVVVVELHETNAEVCDRLEAAGYALENLDGPSPPREAGPIHVLARQARA